MKEEELITLERDAKTLCDTKDREEALNALAELKAGQSNFECEIRTTDRAVLRSPGFRSYGFIKFVKLVFGAMAFLTLCASLIFLMISIGSLLDGNASTATLTLLSASLSAAAGSSAILYFMGRKSPEEKEALDRNPVARQFAQQKLLFQLLTLGLLALTVMAIALTAFVITEYRVASYILSFTFFFGYWLLGRTFWRCPACGVRLSFMNKHQDRQSIQSCPNCHATLQ